MASQGQEDVAVVVEGVIATLVMLSVSVLMSFDSAPLRGVRYALARHRRRRRLRARQP